MFGLTKHDPECYGCGKVDKLSRKGFCSMCEWAISQRNDLAGQKLENEIKSDALRQLDEQIEKERILAEYKISAAQQSERDTIKAAGLEGQILIERNAKLRADLIKAFRKIKTLEGVKSE